MAPFLRILLLLQATCLIQTSSAAGQSTSNAAIVIGENSIRTGGQELRSGPNRGIYRYISLGVAEKALGLQTANFQSRRGLVYNWPNLGICLQRGYRGPETGRIFKFQVYLEEEDSIDANRSPGRFNGHVQIVGIDICATTPFASIRDRLKKAGFTINTSSQITFAEKSGPWGSIQIFPSETSGRVARIDCWCL